MSRVLVLILMLAALGAVLGTAPARRLSAAGIEVRSQTSQNRFPEGVQFNIFLASDGAITSARVRARVLPDRPTTFIRGTCTAGTSASCNATLGNSASSYLVPGAEILYVWEIEDAAGNKLETPEASATYEDDRFQWQPVTDGNITV